MSDPKAEARQELLEQELQRYVQLLREVENPAKVIVFGSVATGDVHEWSDIDLVIVNETGLPYLERLRHTQKLLRPIVGTDIFYYTPEEFAKLCAERRFFQDEIISKGRVLYERINERMASVRHN
jgi:uncharacterized protein